MSPRNHLLTYTSGIALAAGLALVGLTNQAQAGAFAFSELDITQFEVTTGGHIATNGTDVTGVSFSDGFSGSATLPGAATANLSTTGSDSQCTGNCAGITPSVFSAAPPIGNFSAASTLLSGSPIAGTINGVVETTPAHAQTAAQTQFTGTGNASAGAQLTLTAGLSFTAAASQRFDLTFHGLSQALAGIDFAGINAGSNSTWSVLLTDNTKNKRVFAWTPQGVNGSGGVPLGADAAGASAGTFCINLAANGCQVFADDVSLQQQAGQSLPIVGTTDTGVQQGNFDIAATLLGGDTYTLNITHQSQDSLVSVPEPSTLMALGAGLLGLGFVSRRRRTRS